MRNSAFLEFLGTEAKHLEQAGLLRQGAAAVVAARSDHHASAIASSSTSRRATTSAWRIIPRSRRRPSAPSKPGASASPRRAWPPARCRCTPSSSATLAQFLGTGDALVYPSGYHANTGLFESLLGDRDYLFCDELIRPSLADGMRLVPRARLLLSQPGHGAPRRSPAPLARGALPHHRHRRRLPALGADGEPARHLRPGRQVQRARRRRRQPGHRRRRRCRPRHARSARARRSHRSRHRHVRRGARRRRRRLRRRAQGGRRLAAAEVALVSVVDGAAAGVGGGGAEVAPAVAHRAAAARAAPAQRASCSATRSPSTGCGRPRAIIRRSPC